MLLILRRRRHRGRETCHRAARCYIVVIVTITRRTLMAALPAAAAAQALRARSPNWKPKLGVLCEYSDANLEFVKAEGFTSMQLRLNPDKLDDTEIAAIKDKIQRAGIYASALAVDGNHIDPDPAKRAKQNEYAMKCIELAGKMGIPNIGGQSGTIKGRPLGEQVDEIERVYTEKYFPVCEKYKVRVLWETPILNGPNIATGPVGWEALFKAFNNSPHVGLQFDPSPPGLAIHGPCGGGAGVRGQDLRRASEGHRNSMACGAARGHPAGEPCELVALPGAGLRVDGLEGLLLGAGGGGLQRGDEHRE